MQKLRLCACGLRRCNKCRVDVFVDWCKNRRKASSEVKEIGSLGRNRRSEIEKMVVDLLLQPHIGQLDVRDSIDWFSCGDIRHGTHHVCDISFEPNACLSDGFG